MTRVVYIIGALLVLAGATFIGLGIPVVRLEIGWSEIIGGAVGGAAGFVVLALGVVSQRLDTINGTLLAQTLPAALRGSLADEPVTSDRDDVFVSTAPPPSPHPLAPTPVRRGLFDLPAPVRPEPALADAPLHEVDEELALPAVDDEGRDDSKLPELDEGAPALASEDVRSPPVTSVEPVEPAAPPEPARNRPNFLAAFLARRAAAPAASRSSERDDPVVEPLPLAGPSAPPRDDLPSGWEEEDLAPPSVYARDREATRYRPVSNPERDASDEEAAPLFEARQDDGEAPSREHEAHAADTATASDRENQHASEEAGGATPPLSPAVVGRYNAGSASYVMYSNGMIEVETESGTHQFASMQELKSFIEKRDAANV